jgi:hypothetical protein
MGGKLSKHSTVGGVEICYRIFYNAVLRSRSRKEPHLLVGAGAVTRCGSGSGSDGSGSNTGIKHGKELKNDTKCNSL